MAYVDSSVEDDKQESESGGPLVPGSSASTSTPTASTATGATTQPNSKKTPSNFADLSEYLRVNQPQNFGSTLASKVGEDVTKSQQGLSDATNAYKQRVDSSTVSDSDNLTGQLQTAPQNIDKGAFDKIKDASYQGPNSLSDTSDLYNQGVGGVSGAVGKANASKTEAGRFSLLDNYFGKPTYSQGQKSLDNLLVQNDDNAKQAFSQIQQNANQLKSQVGTTQQELGTYSDQARATTQNTRDAARGALGIDNTGNQISGAGALGSIESQLAQTVASKQNQQGLDEAAIKDALKRNDFSQLTSDQRTILGTPATQNSLEGYYGVDPTKYLSSTQLNPGAVATADQQARYAALANLAGTQNTFLPDASIAGTQSEGSGEKYDWSGLQSAINTGSQNYQSDLNKPLGVDYSFTPYTPASEKPNTSVDKTINGANDTIFAVLRGNAPAGSTEQANAINQAYKTNYSAPQKLELMRSILPQAEAMLANGSLKQSAVDSLKAEIAATNDAIHSIQSKYGVSGAVESPIQSPTVVGKTDSTASKR